jgi:ribonuclease P protein component
MAAQLIDRLSITRLKKRTEFIRVRASRLRHVTQGLIMQMREHGLQEQNTHSASSLRLGFTVSKKVGNAVVRNRVKRRLKSAADAILPTQALPHRDLVIIGRQHAFKQPFQELLHDFEKALKKLNAHKKPP